MVQIPVLTPAAEELALREYEGSVAPLHLAWLAADASDQDAIAWVATAEHLAALLNVQAEQALMYVDPVLFSAWSTWHIQRPMEHINGHSILSFNDEFHCLYQALGEELGDVSIAMYTSYLPAGLRTVVFSLGPDAILDTAMQVVTAHVEAVCQAEASGNAMEIDALGFSAFVPKQLYGKLGLQFTNAENEMVTALLDTGADGSFVSEEMAERVGGQWSPVEPPIVITDPAGRELGRTTHRVRIDMAFADGTRIPTEFYVAPIALDAIIGIPWLRRWNAQIDTRDECVTLDVAGRTVCLPCVPFGQPRSDAFGVHLVTCEELEDLEAADEIEFAGLVSVSADGLEINAIHMADSTVSGGSSFEKKLLSEFADVFGEPPAGLLP
ncbi:hypothetical protein H4S08_004898 [Coemansia sp. RSA 1365]|nr:hypothetical protein H4S08_004898 [Coemansia sp. RSA 1365]